MPARAVSRSDLSPLARAVIAERNRLGLSVLECAHQIEVDPTTLREIESGVTRRTRGSTIDRILRWAARRGHTEFGGYRLSPLREPPREPAVVDRLRVAELPKEAGT